jgi:hypothetical protein
VFIVTFTKTLRHKNIRYTLCYEIIYVNKRRVVVLKKTHAFRIGWNFLKIRSVAPSWLAAGLSKGYRWLGLRSRLHTIDSYLPHVSNSAGLFVLHTWGVWSTYVICSVIHTANCSRWRLISQRHIKFLFLVIQMLGKPASYIDIVTRDITIRTSQQLVSDDMLILSIRLIFESLFLSFT